MDIKEEAFRYDKLRKLSIFNRVSIDCKMGWYELLYDLGQKIISYCDHNKILEPKAIQVKEKFGSLRIYMKINDDTVEHALVIRKWLKNAEAESINICEQCGNPGILVVEGGRWHVACVHHRGPDAMLADDYREKMEKTRTKKMESGD